MKQNRILLAPVFAFLFSFSVFAQGLYEDVVYLKDGSVIHGIIIEQVPNVSLKIQTNDKNIFVYKMEEIQKITKEPAVTPRQGRDPLTKDNIKSHGFQNITEITFGNDVLNNGDVEALTSQNDKLPSLGVQTVLGYMFNSYVSAGGGIGLHVYSGYGFVPLFADLRFHFVKGPASPFISIDAGYSYTIKDVYGIVSSNKYKGGFYFNPSFGIKFYTRKSKALSFSIGYREQQASAFVNVFSGYPGFYDLSGWEDLKLGYLSSCIGFIF